MHTSHSDSDTVGQTMPHTVRVWDLPTRIFHWALAASIVALVVSAKMGGNAMTWHLRLGYAVLALLLFRAVWGLVGGHWSRFAQFIYSPRRLMAYLRGQGHGHDEVGHSPLGALSVFGLLAALALQVLSGLLSDDEIAFTGPLTPYVSGEVVSQATAYHAQWGQYLLLALVGLHILALVFYALVRRKKLVSAMVGGDKTLPRSAPASRDDAITRLLGAAVLGAASAAAWWVAQLG